MREDESDEDKSTDSEEYRKNFEEKRKLDIETVKTKKKTPVKKKSKNMIKFINSKGDYIIVSSSDVKCKLRVGRPKPVTEFPLDVDIKHLKKLERLILGEKIFDFSSDYEFVILTKLADKYKIQTKEFMDDNILKKIDEVT